MDTGIGLVVNERPTGTLAAVHDADSKTRNESVGIGAAGVASAV